MAAPTRADELSDPGCLAGGDAHRVVAVSTDLEPVLEDGRHLLIAGVDLPREGEPAEAARASLAGWLTGRTVRVQPLATEADRWNRTPALVFAGGAAGVDDMAGRVSVTEALIEAGLGRARPEARVAPCWPAFLALERRARLAQRGVWRDPRTAVIAADDADRLAASVGRMAVVEGRIIDEAEGRSRIYLHLTTAGRRGFTVAVERRTAAALKAAGQDVAAWRGQPVRVRGLLDDRFGLQIELTTADQIEFTGRP